MGRQFCLSTSGEMLYTFDIAIPEVFELKQTIVSFHNDDLVSDTDDMLAVNLFSETLSYNKISAIDFNDCIGLEIPVFLGGKDELQNYKVQNLEVYWAITGQLYNKTKDFPPEQKLKMLVFHKK
jgi:hypothetical protein